MRGVAIFQFDLCVSHPSGARSQLTTANNMGDLTGSVVQLYDRYITGCSVR